MPPFKDLFKLEMNNKSLHLDQSIVDSRNVYALRALILFFPFRKIEDLSENGRLSYWEKLLQSKRQNQLYRKAYEILQNIQDRHNLMRIVTGEDEIESKTILFEDLGDFKQNTHCNTDYSSDDMNTSELIPENMVFMNDKTLVPEGLLNERAHDTLTERHKHSSFHIKGILINEDNAVGYESDTDQSNEKNKQNSSRSGDSTNYLPPVNVKFVIPQGLEKQCRIDESIENVDHDYFNRLIITAGFYEKQKKTYSVICSSFLLWCMNKKGDYIDKKTKDCKRGRKESF